MPLLVNRNDRPDQDPAFRALSLLTFPTPAWWLLRLTRPRGRRVPVRIHQTENPLTVPASILFLCPPSPPNQRKDTLKRFNDAIIDCQETFDLADGAQPACITGGSRMPLEAVAHHSKEGRFPHLVVIPSPETLPDLPLFKYLVDRLANGRLTVQALTDPPTEVDFEDAKQLTEAVADAYNLCASLGCGPGEGLVDITGGQQVLAIAGAAVALAEDRQFQYVSTQDYRVRTYDITYPG